jgi:Spy/CpxP family protein refolding chaperone
MNRKTIIILLIAAITITMFSMTSFAYGPKQGNFAGKPGTSFGFSGQDRHPAGQFDVRSYQSGEPRGIFNLDLSEEQLTEIRQMMLDFQKETLEFRNQIQAKQLEIKELMLESSVDMDQVRVKMEEIAQLQVELRMKAVERQDKVQELLTPEQLESFGLGSSMQKFGMGSYNCKQGFKGNRW